MAGAPKQSKMINYRKTPELSVLKGSSLDDVLASRKRAHHQLLCSSCGQAIRPGDVVLKKESMGHAKFFHSSCSLSRPHISEPRFYR